MDNTTFTTHVEEQIQRCRDTLIVKGAEYGAQDRLHNFQAFAGLAGVSLEQACGGMLGKHIVSIYDMIKDTGEGKTYDLEKWNEKIGDALNYLLILSAIVRRDIEEVDLYADNMQVNRVKGLEPKDFTDRKEIK